MGLFPLNLCLCTMFYENYTSFLGVLMGNKKAGNLDPAF